MIFLGYNPPSIMVWLQGEHLGNFKMHSWSPWNGSLLLVLHFLLGWFMVGEAISILWVNRILLDNTWPPASFLTPLCPSCWIKYSTLYHQHRPAFYTCSFCMIPAWGIVNESSNLQSLQVSVGEGTHEIRRKGKREGREQNRTSFYGFLFFVQSLVA